MPDIKEEIGTKCFHCGEDCDDTSVSLEAKYFCCEGCKMVFSILHENDLCGYYSIEQTPGQTQKGKSEKAGKFGYLDDTALAARLLDFQDANHAKVTFFVPSIHCSSCIWLLENMHHLNPNIYQSVVNFPERKISISFSRKEISLRQVVELMVSIGYEPSIHLDSIAKRQQNQLSRSLYNKVGIAGFVFGNIMLLSFPEYLSIDASSAALKELFGYLIILLSLPVFFYCSSEYFISAYKGLRAGMVNIDVPLSLGIISFYARSLVDILSSTGPGYMDSFAGLIFFLLLGKIFQNKTFDLLNFERDYKSYFPVAVTALRDGAEFSIPLANVSIGDRLVIRNTELIPVDSVLVEGTAHLDYSFLTGESVPVDAERGELLYAGGKHSGNRIEITVAKNVEQSYLTQLWNENALNKQLKKTLTGFSAQVSKYFTIALLATALGSFAYWVRYDIGTALSTFSAVLIIACPCALALSSPFALGNALRMLSRSGFYMKNIHIIEKLNHVTSVVFDKTGTITRQEGARIGFHGKPLGIRDMKLVHSLARHSTHPVSRQVSAYCEVPSPFSVEHYRETEGEGIEGFVDNLRVVLGSRNLILGAIGANSASADIPEIISGAHLSINGEYRGVFQFESSYRDDIIPMVAALKERYNVHLLSGDTTKEREALRSMLGADIPMTFHQSPYDKLKYIQTLQNSGEIVLMVGDGLNDSGALQQSDIGVSVSENILNFSPASDGILNGDSLARMHRFLTYSRDAVVAVKISFIVSALYNIFGLYFAVSAQLTPLFAAILMPVSSVTVIALTVFTTTFRAKQRGIIE